MLYIVGLSWGALSSIMSSRYLGEHGLAMLRDHAALVTVQSDGGAMEGLLGVFQHKVELGHSSFKYCAEVTGDQSPANRWGARRKERERESRRESERERERERARDETSNTRQGERLGTSSREWRRLILVAPTSLSLSFPFPLSLHLFLSLPPSLSSSLFLSIFLSPSISPSFTLSAP